MPGMGHLHASFDLIRCKIAGTDISLSEYAGSLLAARHGIKQTIRPGGDPGVVTMPALADELRMSVRCTLLVLVGSLESKQERCRPWPRIQPRGGGRPEELIR